MQSWGEIKDNGQVSDFLDQLDRFINSLSIAKGNMEGKVQLCEHDHLESMLDSLKTASDFQQAGKEKCCDLAVKGMLQWIQIKQLILLSFISDICIEHQ